MAEPVKVLEMIASLNYGGSQAMIVNLVKAMDRSRVHCDFIVDHPEYTGMNDIVEALGSKVYVLPSFKGYNFMEVRQAWDKLFREHPEYAVLHSHSRSYASLYLPLAKKHGLKTIIHSHNTSNGSGIAAAVKGILQYPLRYQADVFIGCSQKAGEWLFGDKVVKSDRFHVLNNAIATDRYVFNEKKREEYRKMFSIGKERVFIQVGRLDEQKNHLFTLELFRNYLERDPESLLVIVGNGEKKPLIKEKIAEYGLEDKVIMLEYRNDVNDLLQMADVFLMPSLFEGLSVAAIEAQASGLKCLCSDNCDRAVDVTGLCEFLPLDIPVWIERMSASYAREDKKEDIVRAGFDVDHTAKWLEDLYLRLGNVE